MKDHQTDRWTDAVGFTQSRVHETEKRAKERAKEDGKKPGKTWQRFTERKEEGNEAEAASERDRNWDISGKRQQ